MIDPKILRENAAALGEDGPPGIANSLVWAADEIDRLRALLDEATTNPEGDYYTGLRCGVEDRDIYDRYDAAEYGWDQAFEYVGSVVAGESEKRDSE